MFPSYLSWSPTRRYIEMHGQQNINTVNYTNVNRLAWKGHLVQMINDRTLKKIFNTKPYGVKRVGRPKLRWEDGVDQDMRILGQELEEGRPRQRRMDKASEEGQGPPRAVEPMMMMYGTRRFITSSQQPATGPPCSRALVEKIVMVQLKKDFGFCGKAPCPIHKIPSPAHIRRQTNTLSFHKLTLYFI